MSGQLESHHFFRSGDIVRGPDSRFGTVADARALFAVILWEDGTCIEIDQFDPTVIVDQRAEQV